MMTRFHIRDILLPTPVHGSSSKVRGTRRMRGLFILPAVFLVQAACSVDVPPTPHKKELAEERRLSTQFPEPDAAVVLSRKQRAHQVVVAMYAQPRHLNPALRIGTWGYRVAMHTVYESLVRRNPKTMKIEPCLATHWTVSPDGRTYTFTIRRGVRWHDGKMLTAQDVWFSLSRVLAPKVPIGTFRDDIRDALQRVDIPGPWTVRVVLRTPNGFLLDSLTEYPILPRHLFSRGMGRSTLASRRPVGTGPFRFSSWKKSDHIDLVRNQSYWGPVADIQVLRFKLVEDRAKALTLLKRGEIDVLPDMIREHYPDQITPRVREAFRVLKFAVPGFSYIIWNTRHKMLSDFRVRRALTMLIDRKRLVKDVHHGLARLIAGPYWRPAGLGDPTLKPWPYDPVEARNLLDSAGWRDRDGDKIRDKNGVPMRIVLLAPVHAPILNDEMKVMTAEFARSGIALVAVPTDWPMMKRMLRAGRFTAAALEWVGRPAEDLSKLFHSSGKSNFGVITNLLLDQLLIRLRTMRKPAKRRELSARIERILHSYQPVTFLHAPVHVALAHKRLTGLIWGPEWFNFSQVRVQSP